MIKFTKLPFKVDQVFLTSDTHYSHKNICLGSSEWDEEHAASCRAFETVESMDNTIVNGINRMVEESDLLIHCGDWSFGGKDKIKEFRDRINCKNIILLQGNHDQHVSQEQVQAGLFMDFLQIGFFNVQGLKFVCSHYPMSIWYQSHHDVPHFYGHVHGSYQNVGKSFDVGIDNIYKRFNRYRPISLSDATRECDKRATFLESHHNSTTR